MALTLEWRHRIEAWRCELRRHFYRPLATFEPAGFITSQQLTPEQASKGKFKPMPQGTKWGAAYEYAWMKWKLTMPAEAAGRRIVQRVKVTDKEIVFWVNGRISEAHRGAWGYETLARSAKAGQTFEVLAEAYAWHGAWIMSTGPVPLDRPAMPPPAAQQQTIGECSFGIWQEDAYQLWVDMQTLWDIREHSDQSLLRVCEIDKALMDFARIVDFELPCEEMLATFREARKRLLPLLNCRNGSTSPEFFCFGHAHLDVAWLWPLAETERKAARTLCNQLALMEEYPEHKFIHSQAHLFRMVQQRYPELYKKVCKAVADGKIIAEGGMWVEADTNITGGESLIRQFVHGKRFFREEFGVENELLWLPDVFGYSGALPQILVGCGIKYFSTQKLFWLYHQADPFPYQNFMWQGIDGSEVIAHMHGDYNSAANPGETIERWKGRVQPNDISIRLFPFGHGDGGGGPTREHLEFIRRQQNCEGAPRMRMAAPGEFFRDLVKRGQHNVNRYVGELYYQNHRGTLTSQAKTKKGNRLSELALREAEMWGSAAMAMSGWRWPAAEMDKTWKVLLLNQFHDILPGSSIGRVYEEAEAAFDGVIAKARETAGRAAGALVGAGDAMAVFNSLSWNRTALVELPRGWNAAAGADGEPLPAQADGGKKLAEVSVPPCGWATFRKSSAAVYAGEVVSATAKKLENDQLRVEFAAAGQIVRVWDKVNHRDLLAGVSNVFRMFKDVPIRCDAWDIDSMYKDMPIELAGKAKIEVVSCGPLEASIRVTRRLDASDMTQVISLRRGSRRVDFATKVDWHQRHRLLKVGFTADIHADQAIQEIQFGHISRPNHFSRPFDSDRFEVCNHKWTALAEEARGFAVLNDCKYGVNVFGKTMQLTLLRASQVPDPQADQGVQEFTYAFYAWEGPLADSRLVREAYELNVPVLVSGQAGAAEARSLFSLDAENVIIEAVKPAEDGSGDVVVRMYECMRTGTRCTLATSLPAFEASVTDMLENELAPLNLIDGKMSLDFRAFEIKTIRLRMKARRSASRAKRSIK